MHVSRSDVHVTWLGGGTRAGARGARCRSTIKHVSTRVRSTYKTQKIYLFRYDVSYTRVSIQRADSAPPCTMLYTFRIGHHLAPYAISVLSSESADAPVPPSTGEYEPGSSIAAQYRTSRRPRVGR
eukprot:922540-Rhodomonas_salina.1